MRRFDSDIRYAARSLRKSPLFTSVAIVSLALALALNTTIFALADAVLHPYVPYPHADRLMLPGFRGGDPKHPLTLDSRFQAIREGLHSYDMLARYTLVYTLGDEGSTLAVGVSARFFEILGVRPMVGRAFDTTDAGPRATQGAVISYRLWNSRFRRQPLGSGLQLDVGRTRYTVIGVMPRGVHFPFGETDIWLPIDMLPAEGRRAGPLALAHLRPGATREIMWSELAAVARRLTAEYAPRRPIGPLVNPLFDGWVGRPTIFPSFVSGTVIMVLIIACANLGTLLIARGLAHRRETAIRIALGARRRDIVHGVLAECALIVSVGIALGALLTGWALYVVPHLTIPSVPNLGDIQPVPSWRVFVFAIATAAATVLAAGALPALRAAATDPAEPMKEASGTTTGRIRDRYNPLIVLEVALSTALLMCSGLFTIVVIRLAAFDYQYAAKRLVVSDNIEVSSAQSRGVSIARFYDDLIERARRVPGADLAATRRTALPLAGMVYAEEGKSGNTWMNLQTYSIVSPDFLRTLGIPIRHGRDFAPGDAAGSAPVAIVDEKAAQRLWPDMPDPVGRMIKMGGEKTNVPWLRVIGVAASIEYGPRQDPDLPPDPVVYVVMPNDSIGTRQLIVRGEVSGARASAILGLGLRRALEAAMPWSHGMSVRGWLDGDNGLLVTESFFASLFGAFSVFGLVLCAVGLYGVLAYTVSRRLREFAVRIALGARRGDVMRLVVHDAAVTALAGIGIGAFIALKVTRTVSDYTGALPPYSHALALVAGEAVLLLVALIACLEPVRRAANANPVEILRAI
jgi:putative ABC transport system permease protein